MAKPKLDGVIQAVHYKPDGQIDWVRAYLKRGSTYSDYILLDRQTLVNQLRAGKQFWIGKRVEYMAGTFELDQQLRVTTQDGQDFLTTIQGVSTGDQMKGVPVI